MRFRVADSRLPTPSKHLGCLSPAPVSPSAPRRHLLQSVVINYSNTRMDTDLAQSELAAASSATMRWLRVAVHRVTYPKSDVAHKRWPREVTGEC